MAEKFLEMLVPPRVAEAQERYFGHSQRPARVAADDALTPDETEFIQSRDFFYMATVSESGWP